MFRRPLARGVIGTMATTAVVAGTATAVSGRVARRQANRDQQAAEAAAWEQQQVAAQQVAAAPPAAPTASTSTDDLIDQLKELGALKEQGILTEEEFAAQKARLLGS